MTNRIPQLLCALALTGLAGGAIAQTSPSTAAPGAAASAPPAPPDGDSRGGPGWRDGGPGAGRRFDNGSDHERWGEHEHGGRHWHHHHHRHHHHHHHHWGRGGEWHGDGGRGPAAMRGPGPGPGMMGGPIILRSFRALDLTPAQQQQVHTVLSNARAQFAAKAPTGAPPDMLALANPGDPGYASAVQAAKKRATDRIQQQSELNQQLYNVLTADQKAQLGKLVANWKARMAQRTDGVRGPPAPASR